MNQIITGFYQDEEGHWAARLACGHGQHVRHDPPLVSRPWVLTADGRISRLGRTLDCVRCDEEKAQMRMMESQVLVLFDEERVTAVYPDQSIEQVTWADLETVAIHTNDSGPWGSDVWWALTGASGECQYPMGATGEKEMLDRLQKLDGFDNEVVIQAMLCTENAEFICWRKPQVQLGAS